MYRGKKTLFYNGEKLFDKENQEYLIYDEEERESWEAVIVLPGVEVIPNYSFGGCDKIETITMSDDSVRRIEENAFFMCKKLVFVKLSLNLEYIGRMAFDWCLSLTSIYIPPSCREICNCAFVRCRDLIILSIPEHTELGKYVTAETRLRGYCPFDDYNMYDSEDEEVREWMESRHEAVNEWIKTRHQDNEFSLHRACCSYNPLNEVILEIVKREGLKAFKKPDSVGVTASQYLSENPFADVEEQKIIKHYILDMMGEVI